MTGAALDTGAKINTNAEKILKKAEDACQAEPDADKQYEAYLNVVSEEIKKIVQKTPAMGRADKYDGKSIDFVRAEKDIRQRFISRCIKAEKYPGSIGTEEKTVRALVEGLEKYRELFNEKYQGNDKKAILSVLNGILKERIGAPGTAEGHNYFKDLTLPQDVGLVARHYHNLEETSATAVSDAAQKETAKAIKAIELLMVGQNSDLQIDTRKLLKTHLKRVNDHIASSTFTNAAGEESLIREDLLNGFKDINRRLQSKLTNIEDSPAYENDELKRMVVDKARGVFIRALSNIGKVADIHEDGLYQLDDKASVAIGQKSQRIQNTNFENTFVSEQMSVLIEDQGALVRPDQPIDVHVATLAYGDRKVKFAFHNDGRYSNEVWQDRLTRVGHLIANADPADIFGDLRNPESRKINVQSEVFQELFRLADGKIAQFKNVDIKGTGPDGLANLFGLDMISVKPADSNEVSIDNVTFEYVDLANSEISVGKVGGYGANEFKGNLTFKNCCLANADVDVIVRHGGDDEPLAEFHMEKCDLTNASVDADLRGIEIALSIFGKLKGKLPISITDCNALTARALPTKFDLLGDGLVATGYPKSKYFRWAFPDEQFKSAKIFREIYARTQYRVDKKSQESEVPPFGAFTRQLDQLANDVTASMSTITSPQLLKFLEESQIVSNEKIKIESEDGYQTTNIATGDNFTRLATRVNEDGTMNFVFAKRNEYPEDWFEMGQSNLKNLRNIDEELRKHHKNLTPGQSLELIARFTNRKLSELADGLRSSSSGNRQMNP